MLKVIVSLSLFLILNLPLMSKSYESERLTEARKLFYSSVNDEKNLILLFKNSKLL